METPTCITRHSRVKSSTTFSTRNRWPEASSVRHEVQTPALICSRNHRFLLTLTYREPPAHFLAHSETFGAVHPVDALVINRQPIALQEEMQSAIPKTSEADQKIPNVQLKSVGLGLGGNPGIVRHGYAAT